MSDQHASDVNWLYRVGAIAALVNVAIIPIQIIVFMISPPPETVSEWFTRLHDSPLLGLLNLDLLYLVNNVLLIVIYFALYVILRRGRETFVGTALLLGLVGIAAYMPSNTAFEMLALSEQFAGATTEIEQTILLASGEALVVKYEGTAFLTYYMLNAAALLMFAWVMLRDTVFSKSTAYAGLIAGILMLVPSTFGIVGLIFAFASLLPWAVFSVLIARTMFRLSQDDPVAVGDAVATH